MADTVPAVPLSQVSHDAGHESLTYLGVLHV